MRRAVALAALALVGAACASGADGPSGRGGPVRVADFKPEQIRQPVFFVRFEFASDFDTKERQAEIADYEGALLDGLNSRAVLAKDVVVLRERDAQLDPAAMLGKARLLGADHAVSVHVQAIRPAPAVFCDGTRRPFRAPATVWSQAVSVVRASDGATRVVVEAKSGGLPGYHLDPHRTNPPEARRGPPPPAPTHAATRRPNRNIGPSPLAARAL